MACLEVEELAQLADGGLEGEPLASIERHVDDCQDCASALAAMAVAETARGTPEDGGGGDELGSWLGPGDTVGRYRIVGWLGAGGMGQVYAAEDPQLGRRVALKLVRGQLGGGEERLIAEARAMARLSHPNVVAVHDAGSAGGRAFIAMELVRGEPLADWCRVDRPWRDTVEVFLAAGRGLAAAHRAGILHRDFKPANVFVGEDGRVLVGDFGLARALEAAGPGGGRADGDGDGDGDGHGEGSAALAPALGLTRTGAVLGTPAYMAPEQFRGRPTDARADQFSFAVALYQALTGQLPFAGSDPTSLVSAAEAGRLRPPPASSRLPRGLLALIGRGLRPDPADRFPSMDAMLAALAAASRRRRRLAGLAAAALLLAAVPAGLLAAGREPAGAAAACVDPDAALGRTWDAARQARLEQVFLSGGGPAAAEAWRHTRAAVDRFAAGYRDTADALCSRRGALAGESPELIARRHDCLADRLDEVDRVLRNLETARGALDIDDAVRVASELTPGAECLGVSVLADISEPPPPERRAAIDAARDRLAEVRALLTLNRHEEALAAAAPLAEEIARLGYRPLEAYALLSLAEAQLHGGQREQAMETAARALAAAQAAGHGKFSAQAALYLAQAGAEAEPPASDVDRWLEIARANVEKLGDPPSLVHGLARAEGRIHYKRGDYRAALSALEREVALARQIHGEDSTPVADALGSTGTMRMLLGEVAPAIEALEQARRTLEANLGEAHPELGRAMINLALAYKEAGRVADAEALERRILALAEARSGPASGAAGDALVNLASTVRRGGQAAEAIAMLERARENYAASRGAEHLSVGAVYLNLTAAYAELGRQDEALASARRGLAIYQAGLPPDHPSLAQALAIAGGIALEAGRHREARDHFARALPIQEARLGPHHPRTLTTLSRLGRAELHTGGRRAGLARLELAVQRASSPDVTDPGPGAIARLHLARALTRSAPRRARALAEEALARVGDGGTGQEQIREEARAVLRELDR